MAKSLYPIVKVNNLYDWIDSDNKGLLKSNPIVGYLNAEGIKKFEQEDAFHSPITFRRLVEIELHKNNLPNGNGSDYIRKDIYELIWDYNGWRLETKHSEFYHTFDELRKRCNFLAEKRYSYVVYDVNHNQIMV